LWRADHDKKSHECKSLGFFLCYNQLEETVLDLLMNQLLARITIDPEICHGKPVVRGLRYPVETLLELLSSGMTTEEILEDYADLERDDILAVLAYAAELSQVKRIVPISA
jgi:uncharacterized protein (DUF433 family)